MRNSAARARSLALRIEGECWIGTYEVHGDAAEGELISPPFVVTDPYLHFLVGGGADRVRTYVAVFVSGVEVFRAAGHDAEALERRCVDLRPYLGKQAEIRVVDRSRQPWGHINADGFCWDQHAF